MTDVCLIREERHGVVTGKCGRSEKRESGGRLPRSFTGWTSEVSCPLCKGES